ncbi:NAD-dependent epimerase/dehydratase family protein [Rossellomorea sp. DA94]|uniref:NAD-dependent epimerase/dehydratase family protein n=1 Tax=Rossellomorea sp. DA94 TaxID=3038653 RepID=UPI00244B1068|nr:NAD-dependent epimerase/dehydratase family protein [Rossellomorea sp. DA94]WGG46130.1 NAD-dependent epimerase/dehydratase family protein [Rossellomorea sp. DA94]
MSKVTLIAGATGLVGSHLMDILLKSPEYTRVISFVRRESGVKHEKLDERIISFDGMKLLPHEEIDDVFCCLGTTIKKAKTKHAFKKVDYEYPIQLGKLGKAHGAKQYLVISSIGASPESPFFYSKVKGNLEKELKELHYPSLHLFRPSLLLGERQEFRLGEKAGEIFSRALRPVMVGRLKRYRSIPGKQVAYAMYRAAVGTFGEGVIIHESERIQEF